MSDNWKELSAYNSPSHHSRKWSAFILLFPTLLSFAQALPLVHPVQERSPSPFKGTYNYSSSLSLGKSTVMTGMMRFTSVQSSTAVAALHVVDICSAAWKQCLSVREVREHTVFSQLGTTTITGYFKNYPRFFIFSRRLIYPRLCVRIAAMFYIFDCTHSVL